MLPIPRRNADAATMDLLGCMLSQDASWDTWSRARWHRVLAAAEELEAASMLHAAIQRSGNVAQVPVDVVARCKREYVGTAAYNLNVLSQANRVLAALAAEDVLAAPLKGCALFLSGVVGDEGARPMGDIDIATRAADRSRVIGVLRALGYSEVGKPNPPKHLAAFERDGVLVEVHEQAYWTLPDRHAVTVDAIVDAHGGARLEHILLHLIHHGLESSVPLPSLLVKLLWDVATLMDHGGAALLKAAAREGQRVGLQDELAVCVAAVERLRGRDPDQSSRSDVDRLLAACTPLLPGEAAALHLPYHLKMLFTQPWPQRIAMMRVLFDDDLREHSSNGPAARSLAYARRAVHLARRAANAALVLARTRFQSR